MREIASNRRKRSRGTKTKDREHSSLLQRKCVVYDIASANRFYRGRYTISRAQLAPTEEDIQYREHSSLLQCRQTFDNLHCPQADGDDAGDEVYDILWFCLTVRVVDYAASFVGFDAILIHDPLQC